MEGNEGQNRLLLQGRRLFSIGANGRKHKGTTMISHRRTLSDLHKGDKAER